MVRTNASINMYVQCSYVTIRTCIYIYIHILTGINRDMYIPCTNRYRHFCDIFDAIIRYLHTCMSMSVKLSSCVQMDTYSVLDLHASFNRLRTQM